VLLPCCDYACIFNGHNDPFISLESSNTEFTCAIPRINGIVDNVCPNLIHLTAPSIYPRQVSSELPTYDEPVTEFAAQHDQHASR
jgi:hypothetical protein